MHFSRSNKLPDGLNRSENFKKCMDRANAIPFLQSDAEKLVSAVVGTFALLGLAWLLVCALVWLARWVRTGFSQIAIGLDAKAISAVDCGIAISYRGLQSERSR